MSFLIVFPSLAYSYTVFILSSSGTGVSSIERVKSEFINSSLFSSFLLKDSRFLNQFLFYLPLQFRACLTFMILGDLLLK